MTNADSRLYVYVGTYTGGAGEGIYRLRLNPDTGELTVAGAASGAIHPTYLAIDPQRRFLYAANTIEEAGEVSAYGIDPRTGALHFLNKMPSGGSKPVHLVTDPAGRWVLAANFGSGSVCVLPVREDGSLGEMTDFVQHEGSSIHPVRQRGPHVHSIMLDGGGRHAVAAEYGADRLIVYPFDSQSGALSAGRPSVLGTEAGAGPRHFAFHPRKPWAYAINELGNTIAVYDYEPEAGTLAHKTTVPALPPDFAGVSHCADVQVNAEGTYLYGSNRGHDSIVVYAIDSLTGRLDCVGHEPSLGRSPRSFAFDPTGRYMLVAHQNSDDIVVFRVDGRTGRLSPTGHRIEVPEPVCVKIIALPQA